MPICVISLVLFALIDVPGSAPADSAAIDLRLPEACDPALRPLDTTMVSECAVPQFFPAPDARMTAIVERGIVRLERGDRTYEVGRMSYGELIWRPDSKGFAISDSEGSGQTLTFSYVDTTSEAPKLIVALRDAAIRRFAVFNTCNGEGWYANTIIGGWDASGDVRLVVQDGVHSVGCRLPGGASEIPAVGVIGDPVSGEIHRVLTSDEIRQDWCTAEQRRSFGYCYDEKRTP